MFSFWFRTARRPAPLATRPVGRHSFRPRLEMLEGRDVPSTLTVTNLSDSGVLGDGSLRGQIAAAVAGDVIQFAPSLQGIIPLATDLALGSNLTLQGNLDAAGKPLVTLSRGWAEESTDLTIGTGVSVSISGLGFTGATLHAVTNQGTLTLDHVEVYGNRLGLPYEVVHYAGQGGFGSVFNTGTLTVSDSAIHDNQSIGLGFPLGGTGVYNTGTLTVLRTQLTNNVASTSSNQFFGTYAYGGGVYNKGGEAFLADCTLSGNAAYYGGAVYSQGAKSLTMTRCTVTGNTAWNGGGLGFGKTEGSQVNALTDCTIRGNTTVYAGGGMYAWYAQLNLSGCTLADNRAGGQGAGYGGGLHAEGSLKTSRIDFNNCTIANNAAVKDRFGYGGYGGGVWVPGLKTCVLTLTSCTVAGNSATSGGGLNVWTVTLRNTLVAGNFAATSPDIRGTVTTTSTYNLIGNGTGMTGVVNGVAGNRVGTATAPIDPKLGPLQNNGGLTPTMALLAGSPARGKGDPTLLGTLDQRGVLRTGFVDIGAYQAIA